MKFSTVLAVIRGCCSFSPVRCFNRQTDRWWFASSFLFLYFLIWKKRRSCRSKERVDRTPLHLLLLSKIMVHRHDVIPDSSILFFNSHPLFFDINITIEFIFFSTLHELVTSYSSFLWRFCRRYSFLASIDESRRSSFFLTQRFNTFFSAALLCIFQVKSFLFLSK